MEVTPVQQVNDSYQPIDVDNLPDELKLFYSLFISLVKQHEEKQEQDVETSQKSISRKFTVEQAVDEFFNGVVSKGMLYDLVKRRKIPSVKLSTGKILLDEDTLQEWWSGQLEQSMISKESKKVVSKIRPVQL